MWQGTEMGVMCFEGDKPSPWCTWPLEGEEDKEKDSPLELPEGTCSAGTLTLVQ